MDRGFVRVPFVARASVVAVGGTRQAMICNLSAGGLYLQIAPVPEGELLIRFPLSDGGPLVETAATVAWSSGAPASSGFALPAGCGVRFGAVAPEELRRIGRLVAEFRLPTDPALGAAQPQAGSPRIPFVAPCRLVGPFGIAQGSTRNLSVLGVYVAVDRIPDVGDSVHVELTLPGYPGQLECSGTITWQNPNRPERPHSLPPGCGVRLRNLSDDDRRFLGGLVGDHLASPAPPG